MEKVKNALTILASVVLWAIILIAALFAFTTLATRDTNNVANIAGFTPLSVLSDSMKPTFNQGDLIIIHTVDPKTLNEGDIITFHTIINNEYTLNTHRISKITDNNGVRSYTTMGDNNNGIADSHIIADGDIVGKYVTRLPGVGNVELPFESDRFPYSDRSPDARVLCLSGLSSDNRQHKPQKGRCHRERGGEREALQGS